jgi:hypothetical protein
MCQPSDWSSPETPRITVFTNCWPKPTPGSDRSGLPRSIKVESLKPRAVIAGDKRPGNEDHPRIIEETRQYTRDFDRIAETTRTARELYDQLLNLHPLRMNVDALWTSALAIKG